MNANVRGLRAEPSDFSQQLFPIGSVGVVGLVIAEEIAHRRECALWMVVLDVNGYGLGLLSGDK